MSTRSLAPTYYTAKLSEVAIVGACIAVLGIDVYAVFVAAVFNLDGINESNNWTWARTFSSDFRTEAIDNYKSAVAHVVRNERDRLKIGVYV